MPKSSSIPTSAPLPKGAAEHHIGAELRAKRLAMGLTHEQVGTALKIQTDYIKAIERLDTSALPAIGYVLGYVRSYARYVGLDGAQAVARYKSDSATPDDLGRRKIPHFVPKASLRLPRGFVPALTVLACAGVLAIWYGSNTPSQATSEPTLQMLDEAAFAPAALPDDPSILTLKAVAPSWVQVSDAAGRPVMSRIMITGERWSTSDRQLTLSVRDGAAIELYAGQERLGVFGEKGVAFTDKPLTPDALTAEDMPPVFEDVLPPPQPE